MPVEREFSETEIILSIFITMKSFMLDLGVLKKTYFL